MSLQVSIRRSADVTIVDLRGRATIGHDPDSLSSQLQSLIGDGKRKMLLNLAGLGTIVRAFVSVRRQVGSLKFLRPLGGVRMVLETLHLLEAIPCYEDEAQAMASFS